MKLIKVLSFFFIVLLSISCEINKEQKLEKVLEENSYEKIKKKSTHYSNLNQNDSAIYYINNFFDKNKHLTQEQLGNLYYRKGFYYKKMKRNDSAYYYISKSLEEYLKVDDSIKIGERLFSIAKIESYKELHYKSDSSSVEALKYLKSQNSNLLPSIYNCLGISYNEQKKYIGSNYWYEKAIKLTQDSVKKIRYFNNIANNYRAVGKYELSLDYYDKAFKNTYYDSIPIKLRAKIIDNETYTRFLARKKIDVRNFFKAQKLKESIKDSLGLITNYAFLSDYYTKKDKEKARNYANRMYTLSKGIKRPSDMVEALDKIISLEENSVKTRKKYLERIYLSDSIQKAKNKSKNQFIAHIYNYEEEKKQKLEARADLAESNLSLEQQKSQKQLWIFAVVLTILSSIVYFFYKREKNKKEKAIEVYNTETRLAKKIHDELANDVYAVMNTLQNTSITDERLLTRVEKIYAQTRDISHENSPVLTGEHFESFLKQLFLDFTNDRCKVIHKGLQEANINQLAKEKQIVVYRALQELLVNMKKYSEATLVLITFSVEKNKLSIAYQDNGIGVENLSVKNGLQNMEIRIKSVGGFITFESKQEKGFQAKFQFKK
ncbi:tetratricopeptide repeat-containing sensor histidine kinase [Tenacibaculum sp. IMCC1]|eukprot:TRINITY_DN241_c0_g1_i3.p1 TRINITY_DN241_c0_g1~~TRINITY_DN241_c0_g1_i3.p1  ORF type:complete len:605 (-),score=93.36 TRINITY_DN241_c0_g1_i3:3446-5260(-)